MKEREKIGPIGAVLFIVTLIITKALISAPSFYVRQSQSAGWLNVLISGIIELFVLCIVIKLFSRFEGADLIDISEQCFGAFGKYLIGVCSCIVFIISSAAVFRCFLEMVRNNILNEISYENTALFILACGVVAAYLGIKTQINLTGLIFPVLIVTIAAILLINYSRISPMNIQPILGNGIGNVVKDAALENASFFEIGIVLYLIPYLASEKSVKKISFTSLAVSIGLLSCITLFYQLVIPYEAAETFALPLYQMTRILKAGTFFQRIEPLNMFIWGGACYIYVSCGIWLTAHTYRKTFDLSDYKPLVYIFGEIICLLALIPGSETNVEKIYDFLLAYSYVAYPLIPLLILIWASFAKSKKRCNC